MRVTKLSDGSYVDSQTGEILDSAKYVFMAVPKQERVREGWFMSFQEACKELALDKQMRGVPRAVLDFLMAHLSFDNYVAIENKYISKSMGILPPNVSRAMKLLVDKNIIKKGPKLGMSTAYKLNSYYAWKGSVSQLKKEPKVRSLRSV